MNYTNHKILDMVFSTSINSSYVDLFSFILFFVEKLDTYNFQRDTISPVWPRNYSFTTYESSNHHFTTDMSLTLKASFSFLVP